MPGTTDVALWEREYLRQLLAVKAALHSLQLQAAGKNFRPNSGVAKRMTHVFQTVNRAFEELNRPAPTEHDPDADFIARPGPKQQGRREFLSELKRDDR